MDCGLYTQAPKRTIGQDFWGRNGTVAMRTVSYGDFDVSVLSLPRDTQRWNLVFDFLKLRKQVFIEKMKWQLMDSEGIEFEQYDIVGVATYVIAHVGETVIAGARLVRCDMAIGKPPHDYSYMIRDAFLGKISLPSEICDKEPPNDANSWELTRLVSNVPDPTVAKAVLDVSNDHIKSLGGAQCLFLGPPGFLRMAKSYGYTPRRLGKICGDESGRFLAFVCSVINRQPRT